MAKTWLAVAFLVTAGGVASAEEITVNGTGESWVKDCAGNDVTVNGTGHKIALTGECKNVKVNGTGNEVKIEAALKIKVNGVKNVVTWQRGIGKAKKPKLSKSGIKNKIVQGTVAGSVAASATADVAMTGGAKAPPPTTTGKEATISIVDNNVKLERDCGGNDVAVYGNHAKLVLKGECGRVDVQGNNNKIVVEAAKSISTPGNHNEVIWARGVGKASPDLSNLGDHNKVSKQ